MAMLMFNGSSELVTDQNETGMGQAGVVGIVQPSGNFISSSSVCFCLNSRTCTSREPDDLGGKTLLSFLSLKWTRLGVAAQCQMDAQIRGTKLHAPIPQLQGPASHG